MELEHERYVSEYAEFEAALDVYENEPSLDVTVHDVVNSPSPNSLADVWAASGSSSSSWWAPKSQLPFQETVPLAESNYLRLYTESPREPQPSSCLDALAGASGNRFRLVIKGLKKLVAQGNSSTALVEYAEELWVQYKTANDKDGGDEFYKILNVAIIDDDESDLRCLMPLLRALTLHISWNPLSLPSTSSVLQTFRGSMLSQAQYDAVEEGSTYRIAMFAASSVSLRIARTFRRGDSTVMVKFQIPSSCVNAGRINIKYKKNLDEREYLLPPYTVVVLKSKTVDSDGQWLNFRVAEDNFQHSLFLPSIFV
eukprot:gnl/TRDRNA2_/TRDRNA2_201097_c0_seq1.p1 gnl/TRDRNA2_/TRDRNA2_201097_c0~~gnl/TRDRNA2_/TRDRNA2_201097_c0_seq1.p1  ORF type:complete len:312 (+),score=56.58 gnl/TRDRNA2_/TRDRNA2_201097_c0_seq1:390-1325(+)